MESGRKIYGMENRRTKKKQEKEIIKDKRKEKIYTKKQKRLKENNDEVKGLKRKAEIN